MAKETKLSFQISTKPSSTKPPTSLAAADDDGESRPRHQFVTVFDSSEALASAAPVVPSIPPLPNSDILRSHKRMKSFVPPTVDADDPANFVLQSDPAATNNVPFGLRLRSPNPNPKTVDDDPNPNPNPKTAADDLNIRRFKYDMETLPDDLGFDEFKEVSVDGFGSAILSGYGWSEARGVGRRNKNGDTKVVEFNRRAGTSGIGYEPAIPSIGQLEKKPEIPQSRSNKDKIVRVIAGRHAGLKCKVLRRSTDSSVLVKLLKSGDEVLVKEDMVAELGSAEEERCLKNLKELELEEKKSNLHRKSSSNKVQWLRSRIRVRIISKSFRGGKLYKKKGEVVDVVGPSTCIVSMDGTRELVQDVDQDVLETALPKLGGSVLVLYGKHKGIFGSLVEKDMEEETGVVRDADNHALINVGLDQIAEYVGDPSDLEY